MTTQELDPEHLIAAIEGDEFGASVGSSSTLDGFYWALGLQDEFRRLVEMLSDNPVGQAFLFQRAASLAQRTVDSRYLNPWDTALAAYLAALDATAPAAARLAASSISGADNVWRAGQMAKKLLHPARVESVSDSTIELGLTTIRNHTDTEDDILHPRFHSPRVLRADRIGTRVD